jgi:hypothetical protein
MKAKYKFSVETVTVYITQVLKLLVTTTTTITNQ